MGKLIMINQNQHQTMLISHPQMRNVSCKLNQKEHKIARKPFLFDETSKLYLGTCFDLLIDSALEVCTKCVHYDYEKIMISIGSFSKTCTKIFVDKGHFIKMKI